MCPVQAELQQSVQGMDTQLNALEASLKASDQQIDSLQQELARSGGDDTAIKVRLILLLVVVVCMLYLYDLQPTVAMGTMRCYRDDTVFKNISLSLLVAIVFCVANLAACCGIKRGLLC